MPRISVKNILQPSQILAFIFGYSPFWKSAGDNVYHRSVLGTILQMVNIVFTFTTLAYIMGFYLPEAFGSRHECSSLKNCSRLIIHASHLALSLWLTMDRLLSASTTLRCLNLTDELNEELCRLSPPKQHPISFQLTTVWTVAYLIGLPFPVDNDFMEIAWYCSKFLTMYCETLALEFITVTAVALNTINGLLETWQRTGNCNVNDLRRLQSLYLKAAYVSEVVNDSFGFCWLVSLLTASIQIVLPFKTLFKVLDAVIVIGYGVPPTADDVYYGYLFLVLATNVLRYFQVYYILDQPSSKRIKTVSILRELMNKHSDNELSTKVNDFIFQVNLRSMEFSSGGFFRLNLQRFTEVVGMWLTLLVILIQLTEA
ncbi:uncharacterized protein LOC124408570 [Diprion similis]|uniref:uncharacterized protein LOC124408570 n=1 Tax=Diprion similis TaxID=362088 RepID=UPI001EF86460|nr:uncharacterized protein LOC124408570 [Diprion similis]